MFLSQARVVSQGMVGQCAARRAAGVILEMIKEGKEYSHLFCDHCYIDMATIKYV